MVKLKDIIAPIGKIKIKKVFVNKRTGQMFVILPKRKMKKLKDAIPTRVEVSYW